MNALDKLGLAIANAGYTWTPEMREAYEDGVEEFEAIREARAERQPITEPVVPWLSHKVAEPANTRSSSEYSEVKQEPVAWGIDWGKDSDQSCVSIIKKHPNGTSEVVAVEYSEHPVSQEPVAIADGTFNHNCPLGTPLYAAPVRTKDLTDEEQLELARSSVGKSRHWLVAAVIAKLKEKNKC